MNSHDDGNRELLTHSQMNQRGEATGMNQSRRTRANKSSGRLRKAKFRKRNIEGQLTSGSQNSNSNDSSQINMNDVTPGMDSRNETGHVEVIDVEKLKDLPLVDLTKDTRNDIYVDLTRELPNSPESEKSFNPVSVICLSPLSEGSSSQSLQHKNQNEDDIMVVQGSERTLGVPGPSEDPPIHCAICMDSFDQIKRAKRKLTSTICGHVFCNTCISSALSSQAKCPTCRKKLTRKQLHPLFL